MSAVAAEFVQLKTFRVSPKAQLILEIPVEKVLEVLQTLGSPDPGKSLWVGVVRLKEEPVQPEAKKEQHPLVTRAVMLCKDQGFQEWLNGPFPEDGHPEEATAAALKYAVDIKSRAELATNEEAQKKFLALEAEFKQATGHMAEKR